MPPQITRTGLTYLGAIAVGFIAFSPLFQQTTLSRRTDFCDHSAVAVGLTPPGTTRYRNRGAYHFRIRGLVTPQCSAGPFRKAKPEQLIHSCRWPT